MTNANKEYTVLYSTTANLRFHFWGVHPNNINKGDIAHLPVARAAYDRANGHFHPLLIIRKQKKKQYISHYFCTTFGNGSQRKE